MSELRVSVIKDVGGLGTAIDLTTSNTPIIGGNTTKLKGTAIPNDSTSYNKLRPFTTIITGNQTINADYGATGLNSVYLVNTSAERTITLPIGSSVNVGDWVTIVDIGTGATSVGNASKKPITVAPNNADRIQGGNDGDELIIDIDGQSVTLMWCGSTYDWRIVSS